jgi:hypothetical protein
MEDDLKMKAFFGLFQPFRRQTSQTRTLSDVNRCSSSMMVIYGIEYHIQALN